MYKILLIDDEYLVRKALCSLIGRFEKFQVIGEVSKGKLALDLCEKNPPDLVFMDIKLHDIHGLTVSKNLKKFYPDIVITILTAYDEFEGIQQAMNLGVQHYLLKPFSIEEVTSVLQRYEQTHIRRGSLQDLFVKKIIEIGFEKSCTLTKQTIQHIFSGSVDVNSRYKMLKTLLSNLLDLIYNIHGDYKKHYEQKFTVTEQICQDLTLAEFWLFDIIDEVFKQRSIQNYPQFIKIFSYIEANLESEVSLACASQLAQISESYLSRLFKKELGTNFATYINLKKIKQSKKILKQSTLTVNDIAFELGYNESNYFCKVFKKYEQVTPKQYRQNLRSNE